MVQDPETHGSEEAWRAGRAAGRRGDPLGGGPHPAGSEPALDWADGWREGERERGQARDPAGSPP